MDANAQRQKGLAVFLASFLVVCHAASRQDSFSVKIVERKDDARGEQQQRICIHRTILDQNGTVRGIFNGVVRDV